MSNDETADSFVARRNRAQRITDPATARASANEAYGQAIRDGHAPSLPQPSDVLAYGARLAQTNSAKPAASSAAQNAGSTWEQRTRNALEQADAAVRAAANTITVGGADRLAAAADAWVGPGSPGLWPQRYALSLHQQLARDGYDAGHRHLAQSLGAAGGGLLGLAALGPERAAISGAARLTRAAGLTGKEFSRILGLGALGGGGLQAVSDFSSGHGFSSANVAGAAVGGLAGTAAFPLGPARAGAIDGAVTAMAQDLLNGRPVSMSALAQSALAGQVLGRVAGSAGRRWSNALPKEAKGPLGETLGDLRSLLNGQPRHGGPKVQAPVNPNQTTPLRGKKSTWVPDGTGGPPPTDPSMEWPDMFEDKFGYRARLTPNQRMAQANWGPKFRLNHFTPDDIGLMIGLPAAWMGPGAIDRARAQGQ